MAYIAAHQALRDHRKTKRSARLLGIDRVQMVGHLMFLWWWALDNCPGGSLVGQEDDEIAEAAGYPDGRMDRTQAALWPDEDVPKTRAEAFVQALIQADPDPKKPGFIEVREDGSLWLHDWEENSGAGRVAEMREASRLANRERQKRFRERLRNADGDRDSNALRNADVTGSNADTGVRDNATSNAAGERDGNGRNGLNVTKQNVTDQTPPKSPADRDGCVSVDAAWEAHLREQERTPRGQRFVDFRVAYPANPSGTEWSWAEARRVWDDVVPPGQEEACMAKLALYKASPEVERGKVRQPANWLPGWRGQQKPQPVRPASAKEASSTPDYLALERARRVAEGKPVDEMPLRVARASA